MIGTISAIRSSPIASHTGGKAFPEVISGSDPVAERAVDIFVSLYGAVAGDLALVGRATGGVYVGGGIAPKILPKLRSGEFLQSFRSKGRLSPLLEEIPVKVIIEPRTALLGAAVAAANIRASRSRKTRSKRTKR